MTETLAPTEEQQYILDLHSNTSDNILVESDAGTGKTTMLTMLIEQMKTNVLILAFNTRIKEKMIEELEEKESHGWPLPPYEVKTFNQFGHGIWSQEIGRRLTVDKDKTANILRTVIREFSKADQEEGWNEFSNITTAVGLAKSLGYVPEGKYQSAKRLIDREGFVKYLDETPSEFTLFLIDEVLHRSIQAAYSGSIDFNDQVYMPAVFGGSFPKFPTVGIDEVQDLAPVNHAMLDLLNESRLIGVGDDAQSIYQFRGAKQGGMASFVESHNARTATLSVSFRCPEAIVRNVHWRKPNMRWTKPGGRVARLLNPSHTSFPDGCAIICRNNAPLFALAIRLLTNGRSVNVAGSDIGHRLLRIMEKLGPETMTKDALLDAIEAWRYAKLSRESTTANDFADCMRVFAGYGSNLRQALGYAEDLLARQGTITLLTGHKAKGLEWPVVYHLDPWLLRDGEQEENLRYVIQTRSLETYYEINSSELRW